MERELRMLTKYEIIVALAEIYGATLTKLAIKSYHMALEEISQKKVNEIFKEILEDDSIKFMPKPGELHGMAKPKLNPKDKAIMSMERIKNAITKFGWPDPEGARNFLNETEWNLITNRGGWNAFCSEPRNNIHDPMIYAQTRESLLSTYVAIEKGIRPESNIKLEARRSEASKLTSGLGSELKSVDD